MQKTASGGLNLPIFQLCRCFWRTKTLTAGFLVLAASAASIFAVLGTTQAQATPWKIRAGVVTPATLQQLRIRYPTIETASELQNLLDDIGRRQPTNDLEAMLVGDSWVIVGEKARIISEVDFGLTTRLLRPSLQGVAQNFDGQVDSPETQARMTETLLNYLHKRGYFRAKVNLKVEATEEFATYFFNVNEGEPCLMEGVEFSFALPQHIKNTIKPGNICDEEELSADIDKLVENLRREGFNQARIELAGFTHYEERNTALAHVSGIIGSRIRYEVVDPSKRFGIEDLFPKGELSGIDPAIVGPEAMAGELSRRYKNKGFADVQVTGPTLKHEGDQSTYVFQVDPGPQYVLRSVQFQGATVFTEQELLETMNLSGFWQANRPLNQEEYRKGAEAIRARYQAAGYWDAQVREPSPTKDREAGAAQLVLNITEGSKRVLDKVVINGCVAMACDEISELFEIPAESPVDRATFIDFQQKARTKYVNEGYLYAEVALDVQQQPTQRRMNRVVVVVNIHEGVRVKIGAINVVGLTKTQSKVVFRELLFKPGDWYDPEKINNSRRALVSLGLFRSVQIGAADRGAISEELPELDLIIDVREGTPPNLIFGPGWDLTAGWRYNSEISYNNLGGVGRQMSLRGGFSEERHQPAIGSRTRIGNSLGAGYKEPYVLDWPIAGTISANTLSQASDDIWKEQLEGRVELLHRLRVILPGAEAAVFYSQKEIHEEAAYQHLDDLLSGNVRIGRIGLRASVDKRNDPVWPTSGFLLAPEVSWALYPLGGDLKYFKWDVTNSYYFGFTSNLVLALGVQVTAFENIDRKNDEIQEGALPASERLSAGGSETVRGYKEGSLGPLVVTPVRDVNNLWNCTTEELRAKGNRRTIVKTELRYRINEILGVSGFVDSGNTFLSDEEVAKFQHAFDTPVAVTNPTGCGSQSPKRVLKENVGYTYRELLSNPGFLYSRHYLSYGTAANFLTAIGSVNLAYGLPLREPKSIACEISESECHPRARTTGHWLTRGEFHLNVSAKF